MAKKATRSLFEVRKESQLLDMERDNFEFGEFWMLTDGYRVTLTEQKSGSSPKQQISIPKPIFDSFIRRYIKQQALRK